MLHSRPWFGVGLALLVAASFAGGSVLGGLAFRHGTEPLTVTTIRTLCATATLFVVLRLRRFPITLPPAARRNAFALGILVAFYAWSLYKAVSLMPVSLAILTFYLYPLLTGMIAWISGRERFTLRAAGALGLAFLGLGLALNLRGVPGATLGVVFALAAAVGFTAQLVLSSALMGRNPAQPVALHMLGSASVLYVVVCLALGIFQLPQDSTGWAALAGTTMCYMFGATGLYSAIALLGPVRAALMLNIEPVFSMLFGFLLLGQHLTPVQVLGAVCVVAAITLGRASRPAARLAKPVV
jgi:drug/metabolite transporter (DMT)-like permease